MCIASKGRPRTSEGMENIEMKIQTQANIDRLQVFPELSVSEGLSA